MAPAIAEVLRHWIAQDPQAPDYAHVVATKDHHIDPGAHFADDPDFRDSWPRHCEVGTDGDALPPEPRPAALRGGLPQGRPRGGVQRLRGRTPPTGSALADWLRARDVERGRRLGIATDYCVRATALDAAARGLPTRVLLDLTAGIAAESVAAALEEMRAAGVRVG